MLQIYFGDEHKELKTVPVPVLYLAGFPSITLTRPLLHATISYVSATLVR
jgi:hypothetical protein